MVQRVKKRVKKIANKPIRKFLVRQRVSSKTSVKKKVRSKVKKVVPKQKKKALLLARHQENPVIQPGGHAWEARATFNPAAVSHQEKVHVLYRAIGDDDRSVLGYASSEDGYKLSGRYHHPAYDYFPGRSAPGTPKLHYSSGGGTSGGCEDPRMTILDDRVYLIYTAFDGWGSLRLALTSISLADFTAQRWSWKEPVLISPPGQINKNWALFPEKINGQYALLHSISPAVQIAYFKSLDELDGAHFVQSVYQSGGARKGDWDSWVRGIGPPPLKTDYGWLVLYHAMDFRDPNRYKLGAMILDLKNPTKILYRAQQPILEPDEHYENQGFKSGVVYSCGAVIKNGELIVYYGGADTVACIGSVNLNSFLKELVASGRPRLISRS